MKNLMLLMSLALATAAFAGRSSQTVEPDYTKGEVLEGDLNYCNLGPIGAVGNIWANRHIGTGEQTAKTRMIQVRSVTDGTPAAGVLQAGDVILGVGSGKFTSDPRKALSAAITEAEKKENGGTLLLYIWRAGKTFPATITLPVLGSYSATAPWDCEKTQRIIDAECRSILDRVKTGKDGKRTLGGGIPARLATLGLLATGEEQYLPLVRDCARELADALRDKTDGFSSWFISYDMLLLTEYYLATRDDYVLPAIRHIALQIARGASDVGTFSHGFAYSFMANGKRWKYPCAYGAMNQCSLTCALSLVLARKCGVRNDEVDDVVRKALAFYRWYVDKGAIPYGDHEPGHSHDNNGVNSQAAVLFDLAGDQEAADYFTRMTLASYRVREAGHTGHFFSYQWGALGAARGGDQAAQSFARNTRWFTELERQADGGSIYQPQLASIDHGKYRNWSTTGSRLLQHCLPRRKIYLTGKGGSCLAPITGADLEEVVANGVFDPKKLTVKELLNALGSRSPVVRRQAAEELGERDENVVQEMIALLDSPSRYARYGASEGLSYAGRGSEQAIDALVKKLEDSDDLTMRYYAACAFRKKRLWQGPPIRAWKSLDHTLAREGGAIDKAVPALLKQAATFEPKKDPMRKLHSLIAGTLFYGGNVANYTGCFPNGKGIETVDRSLLIPAIKSLLKNPNGGARSTVSAVFSRLTDDDLKQLWGDIYYATKYQAPSGSMFAGGVRGNGLKLMAEQGVKEGIDLGIDWALRQEGWGNSGRKKSGIPTLLRYGNALQPYVPEIDEVLAGWTKARKSKNRPEDAAAFKARLAEALKKAAPELVSIQPFIDATPDPLKSETAP